MKQRIFLSLSLLLSYGGLYAQTVLQLFQQGDYITLTTYYDKAEELNGEELYCVGYAFYTQGDDEGAIEMYDKAIAKGFDADYLYQAKGNSLIFLQRYDQADKSFREALKKSPKAQLNYTGLGSNFFYQKNYDSAMVYYQKAIELDFQSGEPYYNLGQIYHLVKKEYNKGVEIYKKGLQYVEINDPLYYKMYSNIGIIEFDKNKDFEAATRAYEQVLRAYPAYYKDYQPYIKACYALGQYAKGDSLFNVLVIKHKNKQLPQKMDKQGGMAIAEFECNGQTTILYRPFAKPVKNQDIAYKVFLYDKADKKIERTLLVKKFISDDGNNTSSLCLMERNPRGNFDYYYTWASDKIPYDDLKKSVKLVLDM